MVEVNEMWTFIIITRKTMKNNTYKHRLNVTLKADPCKTNKVPIQKAYYKYTHLVIQ